MMPPQPEGWDARSAANTAPTSAQNTSPVYAPSAGYQPGASTMAPQMVPPYVPPRSRSRLGLVLAFLGIGLFVVVVLGVMMIARISHNIPASPSSMPPPPLLADENVLNEATADKVDSTGNEITLTKSFKLGDNAKFTVKNLNGNITVVAWDQPKAEVKVIKRGSDRGAEVRFIGPSGLSALSATERGSDRGAEVRFINKEGNLSLRTVPTRGNQDVRYEVKLPREIARIEVSSTNGSIKISDVAAEILAESANGNIDLIDVAGVSRVQTSNGRITAVLDEASDDPMEITAVNGRIDVTLKSDFNATLDASSIHGDIDIDDKLGIPAVKELVGRHARGQIGSGGPLLKITTVNGKIKLSQQ